MSSYDDGDSAFPWLIKYSDDNIYSQPGMTLRDWFAGLAMQQMIAGPGAQVVADRDQRYDETNFAQIVADNAYNFADAMIAEKRVAILRHDHDNA